MRPDFHATILHLLGISHEALKGSSSSEKTRKRPRFEEPVSVTACVRSFWCASVSGRLPRSSNDSIAARCEDCKREFSRLQDELHELATVRGRTKSSTIGLQALVVNVLFLIVAMILARRKASIRFRES